jgi:delta 1-pyrroline-5-carboxylate dehydrogenase
VIIESQFTGSGFVIVYKRFELAVLQIFEVGKSWKEADSDVSEAIDYLEYYGTEMQRLQGKSHDIRG